MYLLRAVDRLEFDGGILFKKISFVQIIDHSKLMNLVDILHQSFSGE